MSEPPLFTEGPFHRPDSQLAPRCLCPRSPALRDHACRRAALTKASSLRAARAPNASLRGKRNRAGSSAGGRRHPSLLTPRLRPPAACNRRPHFKSQRPRGRGGAPGSSGGRERGLLRAGPSRRRRPSTAGPASRRRAERRGTPGGERAGRGQRARRLGKMAGPRPAAGHAGTCSFPARPRAAGAAGGGTAFPVAPRAAEGGARRRAGCCCYIGNS